MQQNYLMSFRESVSSLQKNFQTQSTFKRNSRYYNAPEIINIQNKEAILRRRPLPKTDEVTQRKMDQSFTNSTTVLSHRLSNDILKFSQRVSADYSPTKSDYEKQYSSPSSPKQIFSKHRLRSFSIERMISREQIDQLRIKPIEDERMFNNFKIQKHDLSRTCDFSKLKGRSMDYKLKHINDLYHDSKKAHDFCFYKDLTLKARVNYKVENKEKKRYFFIRKRATDFPATVLNPEKVDQGLKIASNFKGSNITHDKIAPFYLTSGKELPGHLDMRYMTHLTNFYKDEKDELIEPKVDYTIKKLKQDLINRRKEAAKEPKNPNFTRDEVCDTKFFKQQLQKQRKAKLKNQSQTSLQ